MVKFIRVIACVSVCLSLHALEKSQSVDAAHYTERAFLAAARSGNFDLVKSLCTKVEPNTTNRLKQSVLHLASIEGHTAIVHLLVSQENISIDLTDSEGLTALHWAAITGFIGCIRELCSAGAQVDMQDPLGYSALHFAAMSGNAACVRELIRAGAQLDLVTQEKGETPLHMASFRGHLNCVKALRKGRFKKLDDVHMVPVKAFIGAQAKNTLLTPLHYAAMAGHFSVAELLIGLGANINEISAEGKAPIHYAVEQDTKNHLLTTKVLLKHEVALGFEDGSGLIPLDLARKHANNKQIELIEEAQLLLAQKKSAEKPVTSKKRKIVKNLFPKMFAKKKRK